VPMKMEQIVFRNVDIYNSGAYEDGTDRVFRNVDIYNSDAGELPKRKQYKTIYLSTRPTTHSFAQYKPVRISAVHPTEDHAAHRRC